MGSIMLIAIFVPVVALGGGTTALCVYLGKKRSRGQAKIKDEESPSLTRGLSNGSQYEMRAYIENGCLKPKKIPPRLHLSHSRGNSASTAGGATLLGTPAQPRISNDSTVVSQPITPLKQPSPLVKTPASTTDVPNQQGQISRNSALLSPAGPLPSPSLAPPAQKPLRSPKEKQIVIHTDIYQGPRTPKLARASTMKSVSNMSVASTATYTTWTTEDSPTVPEAAPKLTLPEDVGNTLKRSSKGPSIILPPSPSPMITRFETIDEEAATESIIDRPRGASFESERSTPIQKPPRILSAVGMWGAEIFKEIQHTLGDESEFPTSSTVSVSSSGDLTPPGSSQSRTSVRHSFRHYASLAPSSAYSSRRSSVISSNSSNSAKRNSKTLEPPANLRKSGYDQLLS